MLEVILLIAAVAIGLVIVMRMDVDPRAPRKKVEPVVDEVVSVEMTNAPAETTNTHLAA